MRQARHAVADFTFTLTVKRDICCRTSIGLGLPGRDVMIRRTFTLVPLALLMAAPALAQTGQINGVITDNTGAILPGATVKAVEVATGLGRETVTGAEGRYAFTALRPTTYDITAELTGFRTSQRKGILLQANENL